VRRAGLEVVIPPMLVAHTFEDSSLNDVIRHELRWARTIFTINPLGYVGTSVTHVLPLAIIGAALRGFDGWGLAAVLGALACRLFLKHRLTREFKLVNPGYALLLVRDVLSFAIYFWSFLSPRVNWRGQAFTVARDGTLLAGIEPRVGSASYGRAMR
jgi:ceramide glucosyltransferase